MTIEELAMKAGEAEAWCGGPLSEHLTQGELQGICSKIIPLIAAELAGVARDRAQQWDASKNEYSDYRSIEADTIALAIEAHARKMGEA